MLSRPFPNNNDPNNPLVFPYFLPKGNGAPATGCGTAKNLKDGLSNSEKMARMSARPASEGCVPKIVCLPRWVNGIHSPSVDSCVPPAQGIGSIDRQHKQNKNLEPASCKPSPSLPLPKLALKLKHLNSHNAVPLRALPAPPKLQASRPTPSRRFSEEERSIKERFTHYLIHFERSEARNRRQWPSHGRADGWTAASTSKLDIGDARLAVAADIPDVCVPTPNEPAE